MPSIDERVEKHRAKIETYSRYRDNAEDRGNANISKAKELGDMVPMGQPILVGHHSERGHRSHISRMDSNMRKGCEELKKAEYRRGKIEWHEAQIKRLTGETLTAEQSAEMAAIAEKEAAVAAERRRLEEEKAQFERDKRAAELEKQAKEAAKAEPTPVKGIRRTLKMTVTDASLVPRAYCSPDETKIRDAVKNGLREIPGVLTEVVESVQ